MDFELISQLIKNCFDGDLRGVATCDLYMVHQVHTRSYLFYAQHYKRTSHPDEFYITTQDAPAYYRTRANPQAKSIFLCRRTGANRGRRTHGIITASYADLHSNCRRKAGNGERPSFQIYDS